VALKRRLGENKIYAIIAVFILVVIFLAVIFYSSKLTPAIIPYNFLSDDDWSEDIEEFEKDEQLLSSWYSFTYKNFNDNYPASVTVTSRKTLFMMSESELMDETINAIKDASEQGIIVDEATKISGKRVILDGEHETRYVVFNGTDNSSGVFEDIKVIGETWNFLLFALVLLNLLTTCMITPRLLQIIGQKSLEIKKVLLALENIWELMGFYLM